MNGGMYVFVSPSTVVHACRELRELAVRGVDGPGMHIIDVLPHAYDHLPGE